MTVGPMFFAPDGGGGGGGAPGWFRIVTWTGSGGASKTISTLDLSDGGMVWVKRRDALEHHALYFKEASGSTVYSFATSTTTAASTSSATLDASGFTVPHDTSGATYVAYVFKKSAGNFMPFTYTGNAAARTVPHGLGSVPKMVWVVNVASGTYFGYTQNTAIAAGSNMRINATNGIDSTASIWNSTAADAANVSLGTSSGVNANGTLYLGIAWGGADLAVGSYSGTGVSQNVSAGLDPAFLILRSTSSGDGWSLLDTTRTPGPWTGNDHHLSVQSLVAESTSTNYVEALSGGFNLPGSQQNASGKTYFYIAIR